MASRATPVLRYVLLDLLGSLFRFPVWWYGEGFLSLIRWIQRELAFRWKSYAFGIWMKNFFVPMYGQHDWTGRLVSVFMRFVVLVGRIIGLTSEAVVYVLIGVAWITVIPVLVFLLLANVLQGALSL